MGITKEELEQLIKKTVESVMGEQIETIKSAQQSIDIAELLKGQQEPAQQKKGLAVGRIIRALAVAKGDNERAARIAAKHFGEEDVAVKALAAGDATAGGFLIGEEMSSEVIELLRPAAVVRRSNPIVMPMDRGNLSLPKITGGATASYAGENQNAGKTEQEFGSLKLTFKKLISLVPISNDLLRFTSYNADMVVRDDLVSAMAQREDLAFIRGDGSSDTPIGLLTWCPTANKFDANATVNLDNVTADLATAVLNLRNGNSRMIRPAWFLSPTTEMYLMTVRDGNGNYAFRDEMLRGTLWGFPYASTTQIPSNLGGGANESEVYLVDMADAVIGESTNLTVDASGEAAYFDGTQVQAAFSRDQTVIRAIAEHDFGMRHDASVTVIQAVKWIP